MKRFWLFGLFLAGALVALNAPAFAKDTMDSQDSQDMTDAMDDVNSALGSMSSRVSNIEDQLKLKFYGDVRLRYAFITQNSNLAGVTILDSSRGRYRARLGAMKDFGDFSANFRIATGANNNPNSENNTFDNAMVNPTIDIDTASITYTPAALGGHVKFTAGKMANPLTKTSITWDPDIQPEGALVELSNNDLKFRATYFELVNEAAKTTPDQFMDNLQLEDAFKFDTDTALGVMVGYEYIPNGTSLITTLATGLSNNGTTADGNVLDHGLLHDWHMGEAMLTFKHSLSGLPLKWTLHVTDNLTGSNLPLAAAGQYSSKFTNQYGLWFGVDLGAIKSAGDFAGTLAVASLDPNSQLAYLTDDDPGFTNRQYAFGSLTYGLQDKVQLKISQWLVGHEYYAYLAALGNNSGPGGSGRNLESITYVDCIANF
ncbi:MAG TPA: putative porin [bacterium]|nr:putative porin [bacterium]